MFCPKCRSEYNPGIQTCADCGAALISELPAESHEPDHAYPFLVETLNLSDIAVIQSVLKGSDIDYHLVGENFNLMRPLVSPARFFVRGDQLEDARNLLKELDLRYLALSMPGEDAS